MNPKSLILLEYHKVLSRLKTHASFEASEALAGKLRPTSSLEKALQLQQQTREARHLLNLLGDVSFHGAVDLLPLTDRALHGVTLEAAELLGVRNTLVISREARRQITEHADEVPLLADMATGLSEGSGMVDAINRTVNERGEVLDSASDELNRIRSELKVTHGRLIERLSRYLTDSKSAHMLQETLITQRNGRYVLPLRAEFKGRIKSLVHDQSASGATLFVEPIAVVEWNNKYRELELEERAEVLRVLQALSQKVAENAESLNTTTEAMAELDLAFMKARYAEELDCAEPELTAFLPNPPGNHPGSQIKLLRARHPLLDQATVVPIDVEFDPQTYALVLTGPNTGGKTVTLKTVGLAVAMAQSGMQIPARSGSRISVFKDVFADIGDEQSIEQSLSTFSGHINQLVRILRKADARSLVLLDELGAGTDPQEGSALARSILAVLLERRITSIIATHYPELKAYAHSTAGVTNASLEFDLETLRPTYRLVIGLPGRSNALAIAERLGLDAEIIAAARQEIDPTELHAEDLLEEIHRQRDMARKAYEEADSFRAEAVRERDQLNAKLTELENERQRVLEKTQSQAEEELESLREEVTRLRKDMARLRTPEEEKREQVAEIEERLEVLETRTEQKARKQRRAPKPKGVSGPLKVGEKVRVRKLGVEGVVTAIEGDAVEVQAGALRLRMHDWELDRRVKAAEPEQAAPVEEPKKARQGRTALPTAAPTAMELDLRGMRVDDALQKLESYVEQAFLAGMPFVRVIHGKGTGAVRLAVRQYLRSSPHVKSWETGGEKEGGDGVSVVFFDDAR